jgi:hypothetical protein
MAETKKGNHPSGNTRRRFDFSCRTFPFCFGDNRSLVAKDFFSAVPLISLEKESFSSLN